MDIWNLADAKNRFSELVNRALTEGPQRVRRRKDEVVVISLREYERLKKNRKSFKEYIFAGEPFDGLMLERDRSESRELTL
ncbi:MAG TPA: type II toxin-antitoxin system prevent-host-death family antitoxin [Candidatus Obscuribacterales bacterium]